MGRYFLLTEKDESYFEYMKSKKSDDNEDKFQSHFYTLNEFKNKIINK